MINLHDFKINFKLFEIREGKFKILPTLNPNYVKGFIIVSIIAFIIAGFSNQFKIDEKQLWKIYTALIERLGLKSQVPDVKDNEKKLDAEIEFEVDRAILEYQRLTGDDGRVRLSPPRYSEKPVDTSVCYTPECRSLGGEMRICSPWVDSCPKQ